MKIDGVWMNEYGSTAALRETGGMVCGLYRSHTGATGVYPVVGFAGADTAEGVGTPVCLAIAWHSLAGGTSDPAWSWCSALGGQMLAVEGEWKMILHHHMVATTDLSGVCSPGVYLDKLGFELTGDVPSEDAALPDELSAAVSVRLERWSDGAGTTLDLRLRQRSGAAFDDIYGVMRTVATELEVVGLGATSPDARRSLAITAFDRTAGTAMAWVALLSIGDDGMSLHELASRGTAPEESWVQTHMACRNLRLQPH